MSKIYFLLNANFSGDNNQLKGIRHAVQELRYFQQNIIDFIEVQEEDFGLDDIKEGDIVFVSGSHGIAVANNIKQNNPATFVIWTGHQYFAELASMQVLPDMVALPETALSIAQKRELEINTILINTFGVSHNVYDEIVADEHARFKQSLPDLLEFPTQIGVVLGGDAPNTQGQTICFTESSAREQAANIARYIVCNNLDKKDTAIMITNGPRTGVYNPKTSKNHSPNPHHIGEVDNVSVAFLQAFRQIIKNSKIVFYDFQRDALKMGPSAYKPMMKQIIDSKRGVWFVPSESTSMVTESSYLAMQKIPVVIYNPSSVNPVHLAHAYSVICQGMAIDISEHLVQDNSVIHQDVDTSDEISPERIDCLNAMESAASQIAKSFADTLLLKNSNRHLLAYGGTLCSGGSSITEHKQNKGESCISSCLVM